MFPLHTNTEQQALRLPDTTRMIATLVILIFSAECVHGGDIHILYSGKKTIPQTGVDQQVTC